MLYHYDTMGSRQFTQPTSPRLQRAVLAVAFVLLGFQLIGGSLHAAGASHESATECQFCLALDRLDPAVAPVTGAPVCFRADVATPAPERASIPSQSFRPYAVRAPPAIRRF